MERLTYTVGEWHGTFEEAVNAAAAGELPNFHICYTHSGTSDPIVDRGYSETNGSFYLLLSNGEVVVSDQHRMARGDFWYAQGGV